MAKVREGIEIPIIPEDFVASELEPLLAGKAPEAPAARFLPHEPDPERAVVFGMKEADTEARVNPATGSRS